MKRLLCLCIGLMCVSVCVACDSSAIETQALPLGTTESIVDIYAIADPDPESTLVLEESNTDDVLMGQWTIGDEIVTEHYTFNDDGTGVYLISDNNGTSERNFTYTVDENSNIDMLFDGAGYVERYAYTVDGDILTLADNFGAVLELTKVN